MRAACAPGPRWRFISRQFGMLAAVFAVLACASAIWPISYYGTDWMIGEANGNIEAITDFDFPIATWQCEYLSPSEDGGIWRRLWKSAALPGWHESYTANYIVIPFWSIAALLGAVVLLRAFMPRRSRMRKPTSMPG